MSSNIDRWNQTIQYLQQSCNYVYEIDKIPNKYVLLMNMLCELLLEFDNGKEELICKKLEDIVSVHVPVPILIDTLFKILNKYPNNVKIQAQCIYCIATCNIHQNATYEETNYKEGVRLVLHSFHIVHTYFTNVNHTYKSMFYRYCLQVLRLFALDYDIYSENSSTISEIYHLCKEYPIDIDDIDVDHIYTQLKFRSCYNAMDIINKIIGDKINQNQEKWSIMSNYPFIGKAPNLAMYYVIEELNLQNTYINKIEKHVSITQKIKNTSTHSLFMKLLFEFAPTNVIKRNIHNQKLHQQHCDDPNKFKQIPFEYAKMDKYIDIGYGFPILMYHFVMKYCDNMKQIMNNKK